jgi:FkbM family methyltransferase
MSKSYSQIGQDLNVLKFYKNKRNGYFVEIGASDGITLSNTYLLEKDFGWHGICAEPIPDKFSKLVKNRPHSFCTSKPVYSASNVDVTFDIANSYDLLSGITNHIDKYKQTVNQNKRQLHLKTISFNDLLKQYNAPMFIDYLSLDTEGSELEILKSLDFNTYTFGLIDVEHNFVEPRRTEIRNLLTSHGYVYLGQNQWDDCYRHNSQR